MNENIIPKIKYTERWFAYFDLLGFSKLVQEKEIGLIIYLYNKVLNTLLQKTNHKKKYGIDYSWFSDTFIIFSKDNTLSEYVLIEQAARLFFGKLIEQKIPVRGALTVGKLYTQKAKNTFLGEALIDAYEYGERQNWLGFLLTPSVYQKLLDTNLNLDNSLNYRRVANSKVIKHKQPNNVFAYTFNDKIINHESMALRYLKDMMSVVDDATVKVKYTNTIEFITKHKRNWTQ